jgi:hypothetical protein
MAFSFSFRLDTYERISSPGCLLGAFGRVVQSQSVLLTTTLRATENPGYSLVLTLWFEEGSG